MQQRYYDPLIGRFLSIDPIVSDTESGRLFGRYTYVDNNPYLKTDPHGLEPRMGQCGWARSICEEFGNVESNGSSAGKIGASAAAVGGAGWVAFEAASAQSLANAGYTVLRNVHLVWEGGGEAYAVIDAIGVNSMGNIVALEAKFGEEAKLSPAQKKMFEAAFRDGKVFIKSGEVAEYLGLNSKISLGAQGRFYAAVNANTMSRAVGGFGRVAARGMAAGQGGFILRGLLGPIAIGAELLFHSSSTGGCNSQGKCMDTIE